MGWLDSLSQGGSGGGGSKAWIGPLVGSGIAAAGAIYGANKQASSNDKATAAQMAANAAALQFEQTKYADLKTRMAPYIAAGTSSSQRMADRPAAALYSDFLLFARGIAAAPSPAPSKATL